MYNDVKILFFVFSKTVGSPNNSEMKEKKFFFEVTKQGFLSFYRQSDMKTLFWFLANNRSLYKKSQHPRGFKMKR